MTTWKSLALATLLAASLPAAADLGTLDPTWGGDGIVEEPPCHMRCPPTVASIIPIEDGKTLLLVIDNRQLSLAPVYAYDYRVRRRNADGSLDAGFTSDLLMTGGAQANGAMVRQPDGRILVAGMQNTNCNITNVCEQWLNVVRLEPNGAPDASFGTGGRYTVFQSNAPVRGLGIQPDGRIIVATDRLTRLTSSGTLDSTFANGGETALAPTTGATVLPDGRILTHLVMDGGIRLTRFTASGAPDTSFSGDGTADFFIPDTGTSFALAMQGERIVVSARETDGRIALLRVGADGSADESFGPAGLRHYTANMYVASLRIDAAQRIVGFGGNSSFPTVVTVRRWLADGTPDTIDGQETVDTGARGALSAVALLANSKALLGIHSVGTARIGTNSLQDDHEFVLQQYRDFLSREGDSFGVAHWENQLASGAATRGQVILQFLQSAEFQGRIAPVMRLYLAYFLRFPDYAGLQFWVGYSATNPLTSISDAFASSDEFEARYGTTTNAEFVQLVYQNVLGRAPDAAGAAFWENELNTGARTRGQVMLAFSESAEFQSTSFAEVQVAMTYAGMLRREPDGAGYSFWVDYMDDGNSALALIDSFLASAEYTGRFAP